MLKRNYDNIHMLYYYYQCNVFQKQMCLVRLTPREEFTFVIIDTAK